MSASEKLRALHPTDLPLTASAELLHVFPQIVAVVDQFEAFIEIHERSRDPWKEIEERLRNVAPQLVAALEEKLGE